MNNFLVCSVSIWSSFSWGNAPRCMYVYIYRQCSFGRHSISTRKWNFEGNGHGALATGWLVNERADSFTSLHTLGRQSPQHHWCRWQLCSTRDNEFQYEQREKRKEKKSQSSLRTHFLVGWGGYIGGAIQDRLHARWPGIPQPNHFFFPFSPPVSFPPLPTSSISWRNIPPIPTRCDTSSLFSTPELSSFSLSAVVVVVVVPAAFHLFHTWHFRLPSRQPTKGKSVRTAIRSGGKYFLFFFFPNSDRHISRIFHCDPGCTKVFLMNTNKRRMTTSERDQHPPGKQTSG